MSSSQKDELSRANDMMDEWGKLLQRICDSGMTLEEVAEKLGVTIDGKKV